MRIDADAHVDETEATWQYMTGRDERYRPTTAALGEELYRPATAPATGRADRQWCIGELRLRRPIRDYLRSAVSPTSGQLLDVGERLRHLDELRIDVQVLYPTTFIRSSFYGHQEEELALTGSYNRWLADRTELSGGRLRWIAVLPLGSMQEAVSELKWARDHGACGIFKKGLECGERRADDEYFFQLYEAASALDVPICIHTGSEGLGKLRPTALDAVQAFEPIVTSGVLERYPLLRVGFIEAGASWVPFALASLAGTQRHTHLQALDPNLTVTIDRELFRRTRLYVACFSHDDLPYLLTFGLEESLLVGTDYTHQDQSAELVVLDRIEERAKSGEITAAVANKIVNDNPRRFYGL